MEVLLSKRFDEGLILQANHVFCQHCFAGVWEAINVLDAAYENNNEFQPRTLSIAVQDKPGVLNEVCKVTSYLTVHLTRKVSELLATNGCLYLTNNRHRPCSQSAVVRIC